MVFFFSFCDSSFTSHLFVFFRSSFGTVERLCILVERAGEDLLVPRVSIWRFPERRAALDCFVAYRTYEMVGGDICGLTPVPFLVFFSGNFVSLDPIVKLT